MQRYLFLLLVVATIVWAEPRDRTGPYLALGGGYAKLYDDGRMGDEAMRDSYNVNLIGGAFINKYLSVELGVDYYDTFNNSSQSASTSVYFIDAAAKAHYPFWKERIDLYAAFAAGGLFWKETLNGESQKDNSGATRGDIGVGIRALRWLTFNVGYRRYFYIIENQDAQRYNMSIGSTYANIEVQF